MFVSRNILYLVPNNMNINTGVAKRSVFSSKPKAIFQISLKRAPNSGQILHETTKRTSQRRKNSKTTWKKKKKVTHIIRSARKRKAYFPRQMIGNLYDILRKNVIEVGIYSLIQRYMRSLFCCARMYVLHVVYVIPTVGHNGTH